MTVFAAGSLRRAFSRMADAYQSVYGQSIDFVFGPAGLLREAIERGQKPDLFASANTAHPEKLLDSGWAYRTFPFARNALGLTVRSSALTAGMHWLDVLTNPKLRIGISTPRSQRRLCSGAFQQYRKDSSWSWELA
jgi:molybdate transport system substrate-binding protein